MSWPGRTIFEEGPATKAIADALPVADKPKICTECVFFKNPICLRTGWADPITGEVEFYELAKSERWGRYEFSCGKDATYFQPKPPKKHFWKFWS